VIAEAENVKTSLVGEAGVPEHLAHLVDAVLQPDSEENSVPWGHPTIQSGVVAPGSVSVDDMHLRTHRSTGPRRGRRDDPVQRRSIR
jgi:hypothetical protein